MSVHVDPDQRKIERVSERLYYISESMPCIQISETCRLRYTLVRILLVETDALFNPSISQRTSGPTRQAETNGSDYRVVASKICMLRDGRK